MTLDQDNFQRRGGLFMRGFLLFTIFRMGMGCPGACYAHRRKSRYSVSVPFNSIHGTPAHRRLRGLPSKGFSRRLTMAKRGKHE